MTPTETSGGVDLVSAALVEAQGQVKAAEFDATNPFFKSKYATLGAIIEASREALHKSGLAILQRPRIVGNLVSVETTIVHKSGQMLDCGVMSLDLEENDRNSHAQLAGSIITYLKRYAWASVLGIYADSDDDGNNAPKGAVKRPEFKPPYPTQPAKTPPAAVSGTPKANVADDRFRLRALNRLKAAPGQEHRDPVRHFLMVKGWIGADQEPEEWTLSTVPTDDHQMVNLMGEVDNFMRQMAEVPK